MHIIGELDFKQFFDGENVFVQTTHEMKYIAKHPMREDDKRQAYNHGRNADNGENREKQANDPEDIDDKEDNVDKGSYRTAT